MGKISPVSAKYIIHVNIAVEGVVDKPDVIGAIFGQTEGLLGSELELRELQRSGRVGRIEVNLTTGKGKTDGVIIIPSSLDKAETAIVGAAVEIIERIGPCNAHIKVQKIEDVRISKRQTIVDRAKQLLRNLLDDSIPDSQELSDEVTSSVRVMEIVEYGKDKLPAGPGVAESDDVIIVEGRADVITLLKAGFKNSIAMNGSSVPQTIVDLCKQKTVTVFVDGDRGGDLNIKELLQVAEIDFITKAPDGKEVEELTKKEIHKALRGKVASEQLKLETDGHPKQERRNNQRDTRRNDNRRNDRNDRTERSERQSTQEKPSRKKLDNDTKSHFKEMLDSLVGTRGTYILDNKLNVLGKVPTTEIIPTLKNLTSGIHAIIMDGDVTKEIAQTAEKSHVQFVIGKVNPKAVNAKQFKLQILQDKDLE